MQFYMDAEEALKNIEYDEPGAKSEEAIALAVANFSENARTGFGPVARLLRPIVVSIPDIKATVEIDGYRGTCRKITSAAAIDLEVNSQPLWFAFQFPWGIQTLGVSARYRLLSGRTRWRSYRILSSFLNAELDLRPSTVFTVRTMRLLRSRLRELPDQIAHRLRLRWTHSD